MHTLRYEPEVWAAYLHGQQLQVVFDETKGKPRYRGLPLRLAAYGRGLLRLVRLRTKTGDKKSADIFVFAQTANQANSLSPTLSHLNEWGVSIHRVTGHGAASTSGEFAKNDCEWMTLSTVDVVRVAVLTILRSPIIWCQLADKDRRLRQWHFDAFLRCHIYLVFFEKPLAAPSSNLNIIVTLYSPSIDLINSTFRQTSLASFFGYMTPPAFSQSSHSVHKISGTPFSQVSVVTT